MDKQQMSALLGRSLTPVEDTNFDMYLEIAEANLETLICTPVTEVTETRYFSTREGYSTVFVDVFTDIFSVKIEGKSVDDYTKYQWDRRNGKWFNSLVFDNRFSEAKEIEVEANWGFCDYPADLQSVLAGLFGQISKKNKHDGTIASKQVEDFRISFNADVDLDADFYKTYGSIISKYSLCDIPEVQSGKVKCKC